MDETTKMTKFILIICVCILFLFIIITATLFFLYKELMTDYECSKMTTQQFFQEQKCKPYWSYRTP